MKALKISLVAVLLGKAFLQRSFLSELANLIISFAVLSHLCVEAQNIREAIRSATDGLQGAADVIDEALTGEDVVGRAGDISEEATAFFQKLPCFTSAFKTLFSSLKQGSKIEREMSREFRRVLHRLDAINSNLVKMEEMILSQENFTVFDHWQWKRISVHKGLWSKYRNFLANPNNSTRQQFAEKCVRIDGSRSIYFVYNATVHSGDLLGSWKRAYNRKLLKRNFTTTTGLFVYAIIMHESCIAVSK